MGEPWVYPEGLSDCCGADCYGDGGDFLCSECHEHCGLVEEDDEEDRPSPMQEINRIADETRAAMLKPPMFTALGGDALSKHNDAIRREADETKAKPWHPHGYDGLD